MEFHVGPVAKFVLPMKSSSSKSYPRCYMAEPKNLNQNDEKVVESCGNKIKMEER